MNRRHRKYFSVCLAIMGSVLGLQSNAQNLSRLPPEKVKELSASLDKNPLPKGASNFAVERNQVVAAPGITLVPVRFDAADKDATLQVPGISSARTKFYCGLYQLVDGAPAKFLLIFGVGHTESEECSGLKAIGAATPHASHGDLILIYHSYANREDSAEPVILSWDDKKDQYVINDDRSDFVRENGENGYTIANIRSLLAPPAAKP